MGYQPAAPAGWTALQSHGGLTGATEDMLAKVKMMDKAFNVVHGAGANLNDEKMKDPISITVKKIKNMCPDININIIDLFTKVKYHARVRSLNENKGKRKASDQPKRTMREFPKMGHFMNN